MLNSWQLTALLGDTPGRLDKEAIIQAAAEQGNDEFFAGCRLALDSMITFGLKQVPEKQEPNGPGLSWDEFLAMAEDLAERRITGNAARTLVDGAMAKSTGEQWNLWYRRILIKDLRCGVSEKTINKVVEKINANYIVPTFACQLAHDSSNHDGKLTGKKFIEVKLDGVRVITIVYPDGRVLQFSRNGKELLNFDTIRTQFASVSGVFDEPMVFDGEVMSSSFQDLMKQVHRKENVATNDAVLHLFDALTLADFNAGYSAKSQVDRSSWLMQWFAVYSGQLPNVEVVGQECVNLDTNTGQARFKEINAQAIAGGYEGIMIKDLDAPYECKRTASWLKLKPFIEVSLNVTALEEGTGRNVGRLGAFVCSGSDDGKSITVNVGSGFSDANRDEFWHSHMSHDNIVGQIVEVRADAITQNQDGTYSLRFPRFLRFRGFAAGEKI